MASSPEKTAVQMTAQPDDILPAGTVIGGRYRLERLLGAGGMGVVYLAVHQTLKKPVAIKLLQPHLATRPEFVARFHREAEALARLRHRNIIGVSDFGDDTGRYYLVFDYVEGGTLEAHHAAAGAAGLSSAEVTRFLVEILEGLGHAHGAGIIHRDLKPANILLEKTGEARISDFGLARVVGEEAARALVERSQSHASLAEGGITSGYVGTADFMAPEVKLFQPADERSDIYAMGVMTYWLLAGRRPSAMAQPISRVAKARRLSPLWDALLAKALAENPPERFRTAVEMLTAVRAAGAAPPAAARPQFIVAISAVAILTLGFLGWMFLPTGASAPAVPVTAAPEGSRRLNRVRTVVLVGAPSGAELSVAGGPFAPMVGPQTKIELPGDRGEVEVSVRASGYKVWSGRLGGDGQREEQPVSLAPQLPRPIQIHGLPPGAWVKIGKAEFTAEANGRAEFELLPGEMNVRATAKGFQTFSQVITLAEEQSELRVEMIRLPAPTELSVPLAGETTLRVHRVEPGTFIEGSSLDESERQTSDKIAAEARVDRAFYLGIYEVTQGEYLALMQTNPSASRALRDDRRPVERVSWAMLRAPDGFIARLNGRLRELDLPYKADLPSEVEWEYACRAGGSPGHKNTIDRRDPSGGSKRGPGVRDFALFGSNDVAPGRVGERRPNAWGFYDMQGNVAEWTRDEAVLRGGHWRSSAASVRMAARQKVSAGIPPNDTMGFRIVLRPTAE